MEKYICYVIVFLLVIILILYGYIIIVKVFQKINDYKREKYERNLIDKIDNLINEIIDLGTTDKINDKSFRRLLKDDVKRELVEDRIIYYLNIFKGQFTDLLVEFSEGYGIIDKEIKNLYSRNIHKKAFACKKLGGFRSKKAIPHLIKQVSSSIQDIKYNALLALAKIGDEEGFIEAFTNVNGAILLSERSLIEIIDSFQGDKSFIYNKMIDSKDDFISSIFIKSAGNSSEYSLAERISKHLDSSSLERRIAAIKALGNIGDGECLSKMLRHVKDDSWEVRALTAKALGRYEDENIIPDLITLLSDSQWFVRYNAAISILKLDKELSHLNKVFKGKDSFAKDIIIAAMEELNLLSMIVDSNGENNDSIEKLGRIIKAYINSNGGGELGK